MVSSPGKHAVDSGDSSCNGLLTVEQLIDEHKVVLDVLLADLAKVGCHDVTHLVQELEHHGGVDILLSDGCQPDVGALHVEKAGTGDVGHRRSDLLSCVDHVHTERVHCVAPAMRGGWQIIRKEREKNPKTTFF